MPFPVEANSKCRLGSRPSKRAAIEKDRKAASRAQRYGSAARTKAAFAADNHEIAVQGAV